HELSHDRRTVQNSSSFPTKYFAPNQRETCYAKDLEKTTSLKDQDNVSNSSCLTVKTDGRISQSYKASLETLSPSKPQQNTFKMEETDKRGPSPHASSLASEIERKHVNSPTQVEHSALLTQKLLLQEINNSLSSNLTLDKVSTSPSRDPQLPYEWKCSGKYQLPLENNHGPTARKTLQEI